MARPVKWRKIEHIPQILRFYPESAGFAAVGENILRLEEIEAIRLKDLEGLEQEECATRMEVSRPTFQRILISARKKIADSLIQGKEIRIDGGFFTRGNCLVRCARCGREWIERLEAIESGNGKHLVCPRCRGTRLQCCPDDNSPEALDCRTRCGGRYE